MAGEELSAQYSFEAERSESDQEVEARMELVVSLQIVRERLDL